MQLCTQLLSPSGVYQVLSVATVISNRKPLGYYMALRSSTITHVLRIYLITDHNPLAAKISKDVAMLAQHLQCIILHIHPYRVCIMYKSGPNLYIVDCLSENNHTENKGREIAGISINMHTISTSVNMPIYISIEDIQVGCDPTGCRPAKAKIRFNKGLAIQKR